MKNNINRKGISIIICCYNSEERLPETLRHLAKQQFSAALSIEIIVIDNASTDDTAMLAYSFWSCYGNHHISFRVVSEEKPGLTYARARGIRESTYDYLLFCDDDNWLAHDYAEGIYNILDRHPQVAACGGEGIPYFEVPPPDWFARYQEAYAIGPQDTAIENGKILNLYGAGLGINKNKVRELNEKKFVYTLQDRMGNSLSSAGDTELTYALVLMGYELKFSKELRFQHYIPEKRLNISYLNKLFKAFGTDGPIRNLYYSYISDRPIHRKIKNWNIHFLLTLLRFIKYLIKPPKKNSRRIYLIWNISYIRSLFELRTKYSALKANIQKIKSKREVDVNNHQDTSLPTNVLSSA
jgi:glycosyltransferase involved in cell wall biosynthesis